MRNGVLIIILKKKEKKTTKGNQLKYVNLNIFDIADLN